MCKNCKQIMSVPRGKHKLCSGINAKPSKYKNDIIKLCLKGKFVDAHLEFTTMEALLVSSALCMAVSHKSLH